MNSQVCERIGNTGLVATLTVDDAVRAVSLARALLAGGLDVMELTLRTEAAFDAIAEVKQNVPEMLVGVGTVLRTDQLDRLAALEVDFAVAPGLNPNVVEHAGRLGIPFSPGVCTPSDIERAVELGCRVLKFFPAEGSGGMKYLRSMAAPFSHLGLKYIPLGGLNAGNVVGYLQSDLILAAGGSWIAPREAIVSGDWETITSNTKDAMALIEEARGVM